MYSSRLAFRQATGHGYVAEEKDSGEVHPYAEGLTRTELLRKIEDDVLKVQPLDSPSKNVATVGFFADSSGDLLYSFKTGSTKCDVLSESQVVTGFIKAERLPGGGLDSNLATVKVLFAECFFRESMKELDASLKTYRRALMEDECSCVRYINLARTSKSAILTGGIRKDTHITLKEIMSTQVDFC